MNDHFPFKLNENELIFNSGTGVIWVNMCISSYNIKWNGNKNQLLREEPIIQGSVAPRQHTVTFIWTYTLMELEEDLIFLVGLFGFFYLGRVTLEGVMFLMIMVFWERYKTESCINLDALWYTECGPQTQKFLMT